MEVLYAIGLIVIVFIGYNSFLIKNVNSSLDSRYTKESQQEPQQREVNEERYSVYSFKVARKKHNPAELHNIAKSFINNYPESVKSVYVSYNEIIIVLPEFNCMYDYISLLDKLNIMLQYTNIPNYNYFITKYLSLTKRELYLFLRQKQAETTRTYLHYLAATKTPTIPNYEQVRSTTLINMCNVNPVDPFFGDNKFMYGTWYKRDLIDLFPNGFYVNLYKTRKCKDKIELTMEWILNDDYKPEYRFIMTPYATNVTREALSEVVNYRKPV